MTRTAIPSHEERSTPEGWVVRYGHKDVRYGDASQCRGPEAATRAGHRTFTPSGGTTLKAVVGVLLIGALVTACGAPGRVSSPTTPSRSPAPASLTPPSHHHPKRPPPTSPGFPLIEAMDWLTSQTGWVVVQPSPGVPMTPKIYETSDGGQQWTPIRYRAQGGTASFGRQVMGIEALHFTDPKQGVLVTSLGVGACQASFAVWTTNNGGYTWSAVGTLFGSDGPVGLTQYASTAPIWVADGSCANSATFLFQSGNGGWHETTYPAHPPGPPEASSPMSVVLLPNPAGVTLLADYGKYSASGSTGPYLYVTEAPGGSTTERTFPGQGWVQKMAFLSPAFGWIHTSRHLYQTSDQGEQWSVIPTPPATPDTVPLVALSGTATSPVGWYASGPSLWKSVDDGKRWTEVPVPWLP